MNFNNRFVCSVFGFEIFINELDLIIHETPKVRCRVGDSEANQFSFTDGVRDHADDPFDKPLFPIVREKELEIVLRRSINNLQSVTKLIHQIFHLSRFSLRFENRIKIPKKHNIPDICRLTPLQIRKNYVSFRLVTIAPFDSRYNYCYFSLFVSRSITFIKQY